MCVQVLCGACWCKDRCVHLSMCMWKPKERDTCLPLLLSALSPWCRALTELETELAGQ